MLETSLVSFVENVTGARHVRVEQDLGSGYVRLETSEAERRQAIQDIRCTEDIVLELLRNARDAHATHLFVAMGHTPERLRSIVAIDDGAGIPAAFHARVFEPRVTSKLDTAHCDKWGIHGRGMALYSIAANARHAGVAFSAVGLGTAIAVHTDPSALPEKADQSTFPAFRQETTGKVVVRGPRNVLRCACEFAIEERNAVSVAVGSPTEIAAALLDYGISSLSAAERAFCAEASRMPVCKQLATAADSASFASIARRLGLDMSERSARRVMDGQVAPAAWLLDRIVIERADTPIGRRAPSKARSRSRGIKLAAADARELATSSARAFEPIAERYYLEAAVEPRVRASADAITITIPVVKKP